MWLIITHSHNRAEQKRAERGTPVVLCMNQRFSLNGKFLCHLSCNLLGVATSLRAAQTTNRHAIPGIVRDVSIHQNVLPDVESTLFPTQWVTRVNFPRINVTETCNFHSTAFNIELKTAWSYTSNHSYVFMACSGANLLFTFHN
jgi:hypothetical protein